MKDKNNITQDFLETVEQYYNNKMPSAERNIFEEKIQNNAEFKTQVENLKILFNAIESQSLKEQLDFFHKDIPEDEKITKLQFLKFIKIGIAATIILAIGFFWMNKYSANERLYAKYFTPDPGLPTTMSTTSNYIFFDGMVNYKQGDYKNAIAKWMPLEQKKPNNDTLNYFIGVAYLADKNPQKALPYLNKTVNNPKSIFFEEATFYLGLAYLKQGNIAASRKTFEKSKLEKNKNILDALN